MEERGWSLSLSGELTEGRIEERRGEERKGEIFGWEWGREREGENILENGEEKSR